MSDEEDTKTRDDETLEESLTVAQRFSDAGSPAADSGVAEPEPKSEPKPEPEPKAAEKKPDDKGNKLVGNLVFVLGFVLTLFAGYWVGQMVQVKFGDKPEPDGGERYRVELRGDEPQQGPDDALVTIIEFADFQCPYCVQSVEPLADAMSSYEGDVRLIFKHYPLPGHQRATPAARVSWAALQQDQFWPMYERLFAAQGAIDELPNWVKELGLDGDKLAADMESTASMNAIDGDML
ncbi:MAG: thioredoxin domain-containing protein, partial [Myxococcales bacterium]|nr:thioredoxin domain-containing protein [Myxococcales bacterium]